MSQYNIEMNSYDGSQYNQLYPQTLLNNVTDWSNILYTKNEINNSNKGILEQFEDLQNLKNKGIITQEEFEEKKKELLNKIWFIKEEGSI